MVISMLITRMDITGLMNPETEVRACAFLNEERKAHALSFHKEKNRAQSVGAWLLFSYSLHRWLPVSGQEKQMPEEAVDGMPAEVAETQDKGVALAVIEFTVEKVLEDYIPSDLSNDLLSDRCAVYRSVQDFLCNRCHEFWQYRIREYIHRRRNLPQRL